MIFKPPSRSLNYLIGALWVASLVGCGGTKVSEEAKPAQEDSPKVSLVQGQPTAAAPCDEGKKPEPQKIPDGAVRVSAFRILLGAHYCGATVVNNQNESVDLNVANLSDSALGLSPLFCNILRQAYGDQSNLVVTHEKAKDPSDKLFDLDSIEFADNAKPEPGNLAFTKCDTDSMGCGSKSVEVLGFSAKFGGSEDKLCELTLAVQEDGQRKTIPGYVPWAKGGSVLAAQQSAIQICSSLALAKAQGKTLETIGTLERPSGLLSDIYRLYSLTLN